MTGYAIAIAPCALCSRLFGFNPHLVPSIRGIDGEREPICRSCVDTGNALRRAKGMDEFAVSPGAYEAVSEDDL